MHTYGSLVVIFAIALALPCQIHAQNGKKRELPACDPVSTAKWLNTLPPSPAMDSAVGEFGSKISARDPEGAIGWAMTIENPNEKSKALTRALGAWEKIDPAKAKSWKQANNLGN